MIQYTSGSSQANQRALASRQGTPRPSCLKPPAGKAADGAYRLACRFLPPVAMLWYNQLLELMGAMGMREARRLRGDVGRAMFFEQLEEETFGKLFGTRRDS